MGFNLLIFFCLATLLPAIFATTTNSTTATNNITNQDASFLLKFKYFSDSNNTLNFSSKEAFCRWEGVECLQGRVVKLTLEGKRLSGVFSDNTLGRLDQLRVLSLKQNSMKGAIPDLSRLTNLKTLFLSYNAFTGPFPASLLFLHRLTVLDLSHNSLSGVLPLGIELLQRVYSLQLQDNRFNGSLPPLNQSSLLLFNASNNLLSGRIPSTKTLAKFNWTSYAGNPGLCGAPLSVRCSQEAPFFPVSAPARGPAAGAQGQVPLGEKAAEGGREFSRGRRARLARLAMGVVLAAFFALLALVGALIVRERRRKDGEEKQIRAEEETTSTVGGESEKRVGRAQQSAEMVKSGKLVFCAGEGPAYALEELLRASAEMLGRGTVGVTYKAVMEKQRVVSVKRLDAGCRKLGKEEFERRMEALGGLRHPNVVPLRAFLQAKEERLLVYEFQPNGSLFSLIHGSRSCRAKPLHWTSCVKIAEDVAQGLAYIHLASNLFHGNLKSTNVLLGSDFEALVTDYGLTTFLPENSNTDDSVYRSPESIGRPDRRTSPKSDVYSFGVLLLELLAGKMPAQSVMATVDLKRWVKLAREESSDDYSTSSIATTTMVAKQKLDMLVEIASECIRARPDERPDMRQVLRMIQEVKEFDEVEVGEYT